MRRPVQSVFFWRATGTGTFKAAYGRKPKDPVKSSYTKDFHQPRGDVARALERAFGINPGDETTVEWRWPGGSQPDGKLFPAADYDTQSGRMNLRWQTDNAPPPWRLTPNPTETTLSTLQGTPDFDTEIAANQELTNLIASGEDPWLVAVHLQDDGTVLHARVYLDNPKPGREFASTGFLPTSVQQAIHSLPHSKPGGYVEFEEGDVPSTNQIVTDVMAAFKDNKNVLLVGPPGTGKTFAMNQIHDAFRSGDSVTFDDEALHGSFHETAGNSRIDTRVRSIVFHPSYTYEDFVMGLLPEPMTDTNGVGIGIGVAPKVGPLLELAHFASKVNHRGLLIVDEFNRGHAAANFGDTLALLDSDKRATPGEPKTGAVIETPYGHLTPKTYGGDVLPKTTSFPSSLYILAAMNSADRSVAPLDAALRRRFSIIYVGPDYDALKTQFGLDHDLPAPEDLSAPQTADQVKALAVHILMALNERIETISGRDFLLGQSVLWNVEGDTVDDALHSLAAALDNKVVGTLTLAYTDNDAALAAVLNVNPDGTDVPGRAATWHAPAEAIQSVASARLRPVSFQNVATADLHGVLTTLL